MLLNLDKYTDKYLAFVISTMYFRILYNSEKKNLIIREILATKKGATPWRKFLVVHFILIAGLNICYKFKELTKIFTCSKWYIISDDSLKKAKTSRLLKALNYIILQSNIMGLFVY
jgi:hypothetical protein